MKIRDRNGVGLKENWKHIVYIYLGLMLSDMPNLFMVYSPQAQMAPSDGPPIVEIQAY